MLKCNINQKLLQTQILLYFTKTSICFFLVKEHNCLQNHQIMMIKIMVVLFELTISSVPVIYTLKIIN